MTALSIQNMFGCMYVVFFWMKNQSLNIGFKLFYGSHLSKLEKSLLVTDVKYWLSDASF
jgi:hypothetical protein